MMNELDHGASNGALKIGAVARLSGISVHTLRKWEERYGAVEPRRTDGGERLYSRGDLERLGLIKRLADAGVSLRDVARLPVSALEQAWSEVASAGNGSATHSSTRIRAAVLGSAIATTLSRARSASVKLEMVASAGTPYDLAAMLEGQDVDVLIFECPAVQHDTHTVVRDLMARIGASTAIVVYRFGARGDLLSLQAPDMVTVRGPADAASIAHAAAGLVNPGAVAQISEHGSAVARDVPPPRFSREVIARVAHTSPRIHCECPHHLAEIILSLRAFEDYSAQCEDRNPSDAALHNYLRRSAGQARGLFEEAISRVAEAEGISLEE